MDGFFLYRFDFQCVKFLIEDLTGKTTRMTVVFASLKRCVHLPKIHHDTFVNLLPQMGTKDLNQGDLQRGNLAVHEYASQIELHLKTNVDISAVDRGTPP